MEDKEEPNVVHVGIDWSGLAICLMICGTIVAVVAILTNNP